MGLPRSTPPAAGNDARFPVWKPLLFLTIVCVGLYWVQGLMSLGMGAGPAAALLMTLPSVSLPSLLMMRDVLDRRGLIILAVWVAFLGVLAGIAAYCAGLTGNTL